jgi:hypothetical protein
MGLGIKKSTAKLLPQWPPEPGPHRHFKTPLTPLNDIMGKVAACNPTKEPFAFQTSKTQRWGKLMGKMGQAHIQERTTQFQGMSHGQTIGPLKKIRRQPMKAVQLLGSIERRKGRQMGQLIINKTMGRSV